MNRITVFCGASEGSDHDFKKEAFHVGEFLASQKIELVYGGARIGLMGAVAEGALSKGGKVIGVIPGFLMSKEVAHSGLSELIVVENMHQRKAKMDDLSQGVIALPGGFGTLEELFEMLTWSQLGLHQKPIGILNYKGFYNNLIQLLNTMVDKNYLSKNNQDLLLVDESIEGLHNKMKNYHAPLNANWLSNNSLT
jgi:uncharacterized protein (TIGR00730 family)